MDQKLNLKTNKQNKQTKSPQQNKTKQSKTTLPKPRMQLYRTSDSMNNNICSTRLSDEDTHPLWLSWALAFRWILKKRSLLVLLLQTVYFPTEVKDCYRNPSIKPSHLSEVMLLSKHTEKSRQYCHHWEVKSRRLLEFAVAKELLNTGEDNTTAVISLVWRELAAPAEFRV